MGEIAPEEQFLPYSTIFYYLMLDFYVKIGIRISLRDKRLFEVTEVEITRVHCSTHKSVSAGIIQNVSAIISFLVVLNGRTVRDEKCKLAARSTISACSIYNQKFLKGQWSAKGSFIYIIF